MTDKELNKIADLIKARAPYSTKLMTFYYF